VGAAAKGRWGRKKTFSWSDKATFSGNRVPLNTKVGTRNAVLLKLNESRYGKSGVVSQIRTGILLSRQKAGRHRFRAYFEIEAKADMRFAWLSGLKKLVSPPSKPVTFEPGENFYGRSDAAGINKAKPDSAMVQKYGDVISWVELDPIRKFERQQGQWKEAEAGGQKDSKDDKEGNHGQGGGGADKNPGGSVDSEK
jgi:hypothetical protein